MVKGTSRIGNERTSRNLTDRPEYWEESWRLEETCCHSNSSEKSSANTGVKTSQRRNNNNNNNNKSKTRRKSLAMAGIDYKKAYDMVPQSWILHYLKMYKISHEVINFIEQTMKTWRVELTAGGRSIGETKIQRGIFPRRCTLTIHNSHGVTEPHTQKMRSRIQTQQIARKDQPRNVHGWH